MMAFADDLPGVSNRFQAVNKLRKMRQNGFDKLKPISPIVLDMKKPTAVSGAGSTISAMVSVCT